MALLELDNISKHFGAIQAVSDVSLVLNAGEVVGLMGDNGAGKSTLVKMIAGNFPPNLGAMRMEGKELVLHRPVEARRHGIEIVHQDLALCNNLTAAANVFLGREMRRNFGPFRSSTMPACTGARARSSRNSSPKPVRAISSSRCRAASARRSRLRAPCFRKPRSC